MNFIWNIIAAIVSRPKVVDALIKRAQRTPYSNITSSDGQDVYMYRYWLFNPYSEDSGIKTGAGSEKDNRRWSWLPSIRLHRIMREDQDRDFHDHPWNARTIVLRGGYTEALPGQPYLRTRLPGMTGRLLFGEYHRITSVTTGGVWTLFFTWKYRGTWGFLVDGKKVPWRIYLGKQKPQIESFLKVERDGTFLICEGADLPDLLGDDPEPYKLTVVPMTRAAFESLPEFEGF